VRAVGDIQRLRLFPVVFAAPQPLRGALGDDYGAPCSALLAEAAALIDSWRAEVRTCAILTSCGLLMSAAIASFGAG
jgi:hypothetical protein